MPLPTQCVLHILPRADGSVPALETCGGRPFLAWLLREYLRFGFSDFLLVSDPALADRLQAVCRGLTGILPRKPEIRQVATPDASGPAAFAALGGRLAESFLYAPAHVLFDGNLMRFVSWSALWRIPGGRLRCADGADTGIRLWRAADVLAAKSDADLDRPLADRSLDGVFYDLSRAGDIARADAELPRRLIRPAVFFDRDGVLNVDYDMVSTKERFAWMDGALEALRTVNDAGMHAFIVTNQGGVAHGAYPEANVPVLHAFMQNEARKSGAHFDDIRYCPFHPTAEVAAYRAVSEWRKPKPGMILDLMEKWQVRREGSLMIGDRPTDVQAAENAGLPGHLFAGTNLCRALKPLLP